MEGGSLQLGVVAGDTQNVMKKKEEDFFRGWDEFLGRVKEYTGAKDGQTGAAMGEGTPVPGVGRLSDHPVGDRGAQKVEHPERSFLLRGRTSNTKVL